MLRFLKGFFGKPTPPDVTPKPEPVAPYKVEAPVPAGDVAPQPLVAVEKPAKAKKAPAKKRQFDKKPAAIKAPAKPKTPRKPRAPK